MGNNGLTPPSKNESRIIKLMILLGVFSILNFLVYFFQPDYVGNPWLYTLLTITISYGIIKKLYMWYNYSNISIPEKPEGTHDFKVDILTTYYPGEPYQMTITTLEAINNITYPHTTYLCDEANDPFLKKFCEENGIIHVNRDNRQNAKAGNINNALQKYATGDICVVLDPDHIPEPNFLDPILPHFINPEIGFVQIVQSYYNTRDTLVARGAAEQTFQFYGPMMMTLNSYGSVNAIGANCVFRRKALDSIGGHAAGLCEDMHTAMRLYSKNWKAVYIPEVLAKGLAPSNLTTFFKQQLKWSRGTFDLLFKVYPKIFKNLTNRQKLHFGILPLHYLAGVTILINFLIPILSLVFAITPWKGNIIDFFLVLLPIAVSSLLIRTFIQKWVIEKKERGFHLLGGLLHINSWWIYLLGLFYTIIDKEVPYLPTPKENEWNTNYKIIIPNLSVAFLSILAIIYGLSIDLTPYSLVMAGFAFFNACIMFFGVYLTHRVTNQNRILRENVDPKGLLILWKAKKIFFRTAQKTFVTTRKIAWPLLLGILIFSMNYKVMKEKDRWENLEAPVFEKVTNKYLGIFDPDENSGLTDIQKVFFIENRHNMDFDIISYYLAWDQKSISSFPREQINATYNLNALPMITWEPWASTLPSENMPEELKEEKKIFKHIKDGYFDTYIRNFALELKSFQKPLFLRFAHEFNNPQYPWSQTGDNTPEEFIAAWRHVYNLLKAEGAHNVIFVWNPWDDAEMEEYFPGDNYVDWIGITLLNYGPFNPDGKQHSFEDLYSRFHERLKAITRKPVMLAEFGSVRLDPSQDKWVMDAMNTITAKYDEIGAVVLFNSSYDKNIPKNDWYSKEAIDWTLDSIASLSKSLERKPIGPISPTSSNNKVAWSNLKPLQLKTGVRYNKGKDWMNNYYTLTRKELNKDLEAIKKYGIKTVYYPGGNIYDYNFLSQTSDLDLQVVYQFNLDHSISYLDRSNVLDETKASIIKKVKSLKEQEHIVAYSFTYDLENYFHKPLLYYERNAFINWLNELFKEIRFIDSNKHLIVELSAGIEVNDQIHEFKTKLTADAVGLMVKDDIQMERAITIMDDPEFPTFLSNLPSAIFVNQMKHLEKKNIILENWQDERMSNQLSLSGLVDFKGRKKEDLHLIDSYLTGNGYNKNAINPSILKPATLLYPGESYTYNALLFEDGRWELASVREGMELQFEWYLVKLDDYGNRMALKKVGKGPILELEIPENYKLYEILLVTRNISLDHVITRNSNLHTPVP
jgi:cellulose synthase (UDP-forming)